MIDYVFGQYLINYMTKEVSYDETNRNLGIVLIATKRSFWLHLVIKNIIDKIKHCKLYFFGSNDSIQHIKEIIDYNISYYKINDFDNIKEYNKLLLNRDFWSVFSEPYILVTQPDCLLLRNINESDLKYDYIGALCGPLDDKYIMNGGLSIRKRETMIEICDNLSNEVKNGTIPEDIVFSNNIKNNKKYKCPTKNECFNFSIESIGNLDYALGIHGTNKYYIHPTIRKKFIDKFILI